MIWLMGKVYDLSETAVDEVEKDVEARLLSYTKCKMRVKIGLSCIFNDRQDTHPCQCRM